MKQSTVFLFVFALFAAVYFLHIQECFENHPNSKIDHKCPPNSEKCPSGDCKLKGDLYGMCGYSP